MHFTVGKFYLELKKKKKIMLAAVWRMGSNGARRKVGRAVGRF